jgi:hypothetical protein
MNAFNNVNLAATCILTSTEYAKELGIPEDRWVYPLGGAGTDDADHCGFSSLPFRKLSLTEIYSLGTAKFLLQSLDIPLARRRT